jgi:hypothetical protein
MELLNKLTSIPLPILLLSSLGLGVFYLVSLAVYRLYLSPIAHFPGPKLAALSKWYEFYYDVVLQGSFSAHIRELHSKYGKSYSFNIAF